MPLNVAKKPLADTCLAGCASDYKCGPQRIVIDGESFSPFVEVKFIGSGSIEDLVEMGNFQTAESYTASKNITITVGNQSSPKFDNLAVIKAFDYGQDNGCTITLEIVDEQGGMFQTFVDRIARKISTDMCEALQVQLQHRFGWIVTMCNGSTRMMPPDGGAWRTANMTAMEVEFAKGIVSYRITAQDTGPMIFTARSNAVYGSDEEPMKLKDAIRQLIVLDETNPPILQDVAFMSKTKNGAIELTDWDFDPEVKGTWTCDNQDKISVVRKWCEGVRTQNGYGISLFIDSSPKVPEKTPNVLVLLEDVPFECNGSDACGSLGTFIVNAGKCSNVISFNPTLNWRGAWSRHTVGGSASPTDGGITERDLDRELNCPIKPKGEGSQMAIPPNPWALRVYGPEQVTEMTKIAQEAHNRANRELARNFAGITAQLVIQGDPLPPFNDIKTIKDRFGSIIVINPFYIRPDGGGNNEWLAEPMCNQVLSNRQWLFGRISHSIRSGSYTTTCDLSLATPGTELGKNARFGGDSKGYKPKDTCVGQDEMDQGLVDLIGGDIGTV